MREVAYLILGLIAIFAALPAFAQSCPARDVLARALEDTYEEVPRMQAMTSGGDLLEIFAAPSGSWTATISKPGGRSCPIASGHGLDVIAPLDGDPA